MSTPRRTIDTIPREGGGELVASELGGDVEIAALTGRPGRPRSVDIRRAELARVARALDEAAISEPTPDPARARWTAPTAPAAPPPVEVARVMFWRTPGDVRGLFVARVTIAAAGSERAAVEVFPADSEPATRPAGWHVGHRAPGPVAREAFEALEAAALAAAPEGSRAGIVDALARWADAESWPNGRDGWNGRQPTEPRTLREFWAVMPGSGGTLASPEAVEAARAAPEPEPTTRHRPPVDVAAAAADLARHRAQDAEARAMRERATRIANAKTGRRDIALRPTADELAAAEQERARFEALPPAEQVKHTRAMRARWAEESARWDAAFAEAMTAERLAALRSSDDGAPAGLPSTGSR